MVADVLFARAREYDVRGPSTTETRNLRVSVEMGAAIVYEDSKTGCFPKTPPLSSAVSTSSRLAILLVVVLFLLTSACPVSRAGSDRPPNPESPALSGSSAAPAVDTLEITLIATIALILAWLRVVKDFRHYKGLLHVLLWSGYTWIFLTFIAAGTFVLDYLLLPLISSFRMLHGFIAHPVLVLGHAGVSSAFAYYGSPAILAKLPLHPDGTSARGAPNTRKPEKTTTEMNAVFEAMRESLEGYVNATLLDWTLQYDWSVLKFAANTLFMDRSSSEAITPDEKERLCGDVEAYRKSDDAREDRQKKYELLRKMMAQCSFQDLRGRLARAGKTS
jgi:hypothetical protein